MFFGLSLLDGLMRYNIMMEKKMILDIGQIGLQNMLQGYKKEIREAIELLMEKDLDAAKYLLSLVQRGAMEEIALKEEEDREFNEPYWMAEAREAKMEADVDARLDWEAARNQR
jgi:methanogenic corrinoid protein MtbC1